MRRALTLVFAAVLLAGIAAPAHAAWPGEPEPGTAAWISRDASNMHDALGRWEDELSNPAFQLQLREQGHATWLAGVQRQLASPDRPRITAAWAIPGGDTGDPYRGLDLWNEKRGIVQAVDFTNRNGALLRGHVWAPLPGKFRAPYPAVVFTTGSIQAPEASYYWVAQGLAEAGYLVLTYDVQGQGQSETFGHLPDGSRWCGDPKPYATPAEEAGAPEQGDCPGVPSQQIANFARGTTDALDLLFSTPSKPYRWLKAFLPSSEGTAAFNPYWRLLDRKRVGIAGHSLGATAVSLVQQWEPRIRAVVAFDNLSAVKRPRVPALGINAEYFFNPTPTNDRPDPDAKNEAFRTWRKAGVDAMQVALRGSTHMEFCYIPVLLPASHSGERIAMYYTLAWFDRYVRGDRRATKRLTAYAFDESADRSAIGAGAWVAPLGNVPYKISGLWVWNRLSFYYRSSYFLERGKVRIDDMLQASLPS
jgi:dienelactone hydrolase